MRVCKVLAMAAGVGLAWAPLAQAQSCNAGWIDGPGMGVTGVLGEVNAMTTWDPDGGGPQLPRLIIGGDLVAVENAKARAIAQFNVLTQSWTNVGSGLDDEVDALAVLSTGELVAGGDFLNAGATPAARLARWNGSGWSAFGAGANAAVLALHAPATGGLIIGGSFSAVDTVPASRIARWDGTTWSALGSGVDALVYAVAAMSNGNIIAAGSFTNAGGVSASRVARWDGTQWHTLGAPGVEGVNNIARALLVLPGNEMLVGGLFTAAGGVPTNYVAKWNGTAWSPMPGVSGPSSSVNALATLSTGEFVAGGFFPSPSKNIARWNGTTWTGMNGGTGADVRALLPRSDGSIVVGGIFNAVGATTTTNGLGAAALASWNPSTGWTASTNGTSDVIEDAVTLTDGRTVAVGLFNRIADVPATNLAIWNGATWEAPWTFDAVRVSALLALPSNSFVAAGLFDSIDGVPYESIARWDGAGWQAYGAGVDGHVRDLAKLSNGQIIAAGTIPPKNHITRWDGATWQSLGQGLNGSVATLAVAPNDDVYVGGVFTTAGGAPAGRIARWNGSLWSPVGTGMTNGDVETLAFSPSGVLHAGGSFIAAGGVPGYLASWNGGSWLPFGAGPNGTVSSMSFDTNGDLYIGGDFTSIDAVSANGIARQTGGAWSSLGQGLEGLPSVVRRIVLHPSNEVLAFGDFGRAGNEISAYWARYSFDMHPWLADAPDAQSVDEGDNATFTAAPASGYTNLVATWELENAPGSNAYTVIVNGKMPGTNSFAVITPLATGKSPGDSTLTVLDADIALDGRRVRFNATNACGSMQSKGVLLTVNVPSTCYPDCDASGSLTIDDFICFQTLFAIGDPAADCDASGTLSIDDFICFQTYFAIGC